MLRRAIWVATILFGTTGVLLAGGFWDKIPYTEWSDKQIQKILTDSPWAKKVAIGSGPRRSSSGGFAAEGNRGPGGGFPSGDGLPGSGSAGRGGRGRAQAPGIGMTLLIRWESARPVKQARMLASGTATKASPEEIEKYLNQDDPNYMVSVSGLPGPMLERMEPSRLAGLATLLRKGHDPIHAESAQLLKQQPPLVLFSFPKTDAVQLEDGSVEFFLELQRTKVKKKFKLKDLLYQEELAI